MKTEEFWSGPFGDEYLERNQVDWRGRIPFWDQIIKFTRVKSVLEVGANCGWNLRAINAVDTLISIEGIDVNLKAVEESARVGVVVQNIGALDLPEHYDANSRDMVFTAGVLIHVSPADLAQVMQNIIAVSRKYVLAIEYDSEDSQEINYRGHTGKLWKRPYGRLYQALDLKLVLEGEARGFDACHFWLMEKS